MRKAVNNRLKSKIKRLKKPHKTTGSNGFLKPVTLKYLRCTRGWKKEKGNG